MRLKRLTLKNWRNFGDVTFDVLDRLFVIGPNASGKSNLLDALRFLGQVAADGGGFQAAVGARGGMGKLRCFATGTSNNDPVTIRVALEEGKTRWTYEIAFTSETKGRRRPVLVSERVRKDGKLKLNRPNAGDRKDPERMTQTFLEQVASNREFRSIAGFLRSIRHLHFHSVPHLIRDARAIRENEGVLGGVPFGGADLIARMAETPFPTRQKRLRRIRAALEVAVPQFRSLELERDGRGVWHLRAGYEHWRPRSARQDERDLSDGTLRLVALLWSLMELGGARKGKGLLLLEEPELSLRESIIWQLPGLFGHVCRPGGAQVLVTTHSEEILRDEGLGLNEVLILKPGTEGTEAFKAGSIKDAKVKLFDAGLHLAEIVDPYTRPPMVGDFARKVMAA